MAIPGFGLAGADSRETGGQVELLELVDGTNVQQFRRRAKQNNSMQTPTITAWGLKTFGSIFPESITLTVTEEAIPHEAWTGQIPNLSTDCVELDACLIFRARATLSITGKAPVGATIAATGWESAIGGVTLASAFTAAGIDPTKLILTNNSSTELRVDWHQFNREWQCIVPGSPTGVHVLTPTLIAASALKGTYTFTWTWGAEAFPTHSESFQQM